MWKSAAVFCGALVMGGAAHAGIDAPYTKVGMASQPELVDGGFGTFTSPGVGGGSESITIQGSPFAAVSAAADTDPNSIASGLGYMTYFFEVVGPGSGTVDLLAATTLSISQKVTGGSIGGAGAEVILQDGAVSKEIDVTGSGVASYSGVIPFTADVGFEDYVTISAYAYSQGDGHGGDSGVGSAYADPYITFAGPHDGYSLEFGPVLNGAPSAAPEPGTWAMMLLGVAGIGVAARRRTQGLATS